MARAKPKKKVVPKVDPLKRVSRAALAAMTGRDLQEVYALFAQGKAGAPTMDSRMRIEEFAGKAFVEANLAAKAGGEGVAALKARKLEYELEELERQHALLSGSLIKREVALDTLDAIMAEVRRLIRQKFEHELPPKYQGKNEAERRELNVSALNEIDAAIRAGNAQMVKGAP